jgi:hypothetical protein
MDSSVSKMMRMIAIVFMGGMMYDAYLASQANQWDYMVGYSFIGALGTGIFTALWAWTTYNVKEVLKGKDRKDLGGNLIATSIAIPGVMVSVCFIGGSTIAALHGQWDYVVGMSLLGGLCCAVITALWCWAEYNYCYNATYNSNFR